MNLASYKKFSHVLLGLTALFLAACDVVPTEINTALQEEGRQNYTGPACATTDACNFQTFFWTPMATNYTCDNCHDSSNQGTTLFMHEGNVNTAYSEALKVVNLTTPESSPVIQRILAGHKGSCDPASTCTAMSAVVTTFIENWANGGSSAGSGEDPGVGAIVLEVPVQKNAGASKTLPDASVNTSVLSDFQPVHSLLTQYCATCHVESAAIPQSPFFAESDAAAAYEALRSSQKLDLDTPANSRLVLRLIEGHNCWDLTAATLDSDKYVCATAMRSAIETFAGTIGVTEVDANWVVSKALKLREGQIASGGKRDDSSTIALYEFKAGSGNTISDTSGIAPALDLTLSGSEGIDYKWVGGWGMEFISGNAQAGTTVSKKLHTLIGQSGAYSIEAWIVPGNISQGTAGEPARIISYSASHTARNFTLGQAEYRYEFMQRSSTTNANGEPSLITNADDRDLQAAQQHVVVTYDRVNGRKVYVNGVDTGDNDPVDYGNLNEWDDSYALIFGSEVGGGHPWQGKLRLVAIHNSAMTPAQIQQNFEAGVGEKFFLLFGVSEHLNNPACFLPAENAGDPDVPQCYVMFQVSQYDSYSYLFYKPTFVSLNPAFQPDNTVIKGLRIGLNGKEPGAGQAFVNIDTTINSNSFASEGQVLSPLGSIIALEKGADNDEFFLTFERLGGKSDVRVEMECGVNASCTTPVVDGTPTSDIGLRTFEEINASMAAVTGVDMNATGNASVKNTYTLVKQQLPTVETLEAFLPAHQMGVIQVAIQYCNALVEDPTLRSNFYGNFDFSADVASAYGSGDSAQKQQMLDALYDRMLGLPDSNGTALSDVPSRAELKAELFGPAATNPNNLFDRLAVPANGTDSARTRAIAKALCTATLSSAALLLQ